MRYDARSCSCFYLTTVRLIFFFGTAYQKSQHSLVLKSGPKFTSFSRKWIWCSEDKMLKEKKKRTFWVKEVLFRMAYRKENQSRSNHMTLGICNSKLRFWINFDISFFWVFYIFNQLRKTQLCYWEICKDSRIVLSVK